MPSEEKIVHAKLLGDKRKNKSSYFRVKLKRIKFGL